MGKIPALKYPKKGILRENPDAAGIYGKNCCKKSEKDVTFT
jgi:hypothetical protein